MIQTQARDQEGMHLATPGDLERMLHLPQAFHAENAEAGLLDGFDSDFWCRYWGAMIRDGLGIVLYCTPSGDSGERPVGMLCATVAIAHADGAIQVAEALWYMEDGYRKGALAGRMVGALEVFARGAGARRVAMTHLVDKTGVRLSRLFKRWGYAPFEVGYIKDMSYPESEK